MHIVLHTNLAQLTFKPKAGTTIYHLNIAIFNGLKLIYIKNISENVSVFYIYHLI